MDENDIKFGFFARGVFQALCVLSVLVAVYFPELLAHYIGLILFLALDLKSLIKITRLHIFLETLGVRIEDRKYKNITIKRRMEIAREEHNEKYRRKRIKDPRLPKNW